MSTATPLTICATVSSSVGSISSGVYGCLKGDAEAWPQQIVRIWKLDDNFGRLGSRVKFVRSGDETAFVRILIASGQGKPEVPPVGRLLEKF